MPHPHLRARPLKLSSPGVESSSTVCPEAFAIDENTQSTSIASLMGFVSPSALSGSESTSCLLSRFPGLARSSSLVFFGPRVRWQVPSSPATVPLSGFHSLSATLIPRFPPSPFSDESRSWGLSLQGLCLLQSPQQLLALGYPLDVFPDGFVSSFLGRGTVRHLDRT